MKLLVNKKTGNVPFIMVTGKDFVRDEMPLDKAEKIYENGKKRASNRFPGYPVCVDEKYFFFAASTFVEETTKPKRRKKKNA